MALVARGAKRPTSQLRGMLSPFCALSMSWSGRGEVKTLMRAEWSGGLIPLRGEALLSAFYVNELLVRLLARGDAHPQLFGAYAHALRELALDEGPLDATLRAFEIVLLRETGVLPSLEICSDGVPIDAYRLYRVEQQRGLVQTEARGNALCITGSTALALSAGKRLSASAAAEAKAMLRSIIRYHLDGRPLNTRRILQDLREL